MIKKINTKAKQKAKEYFIKLGYNMNGMVLHHIDINLKKNNWKRYNKWDICDLIPMTKQQHRKYHMQIEQKTRIRTKNHNKNISKGMNQNISRNYIIKIERKQEIIEKDIKYFNYLSEVARYLKCSRQLVSQCLKKNTHNKKAKGYNIILVENIGD